MKKRIDYYKTAPQAVDAIMGMEKYVNSCALEKSLLELIKLRVSQINGCAYCVDLHTADAQKNGETQRRLHAVVVWRESPFFTERERAALHWAESITLVSETHAPDDVYDEVTKHFSEKEVVDLTMSIITINSWNRLAVSFRKTPTT